MISAIPSSCASSSSYLFELKGCGSVNRFYSLFCCCGTPSVCQHLLQADKKCQFVLFRCHADIILPALIPSTAVHHLSVSAEEWFRPAIDFPAQDFSCRPYL